MKEQVFSQSSCMLGNNVWITNGPQTSVSWAEGFWNLCVLRNERSRDRLDHNVIPPHDFIRVPPRKGRARPDHTHTHLLPYTLTRAQSSTTSSDVIKHT